MVVVGRVGSRHSALAAYLDHVCSVMIQKGKMHFYENKSKNVLLLYS
jgi:hypothetical protein